MIAYFAEWHCEIYIFGGIEFFYKNTLTNTFSAFHGETNTFTPVKTLGSAKLPLYGCSFLWSRLQ